MSSVIDWHGRFVSTILPETARHSKQRIGHYKAYSDQLIRSKQALAIVEGKMKNSLAF